MERVSMDVESWSLVEVVVTSSDDDPVGIQASFAGYVH